MCERLAAGQRLTERRESPSEFREQITVLRYFGVDN
jgi:hypothetical protein